jgi:RNA polymerase sigma-70 factor (ECF subfamily)
VVVDLEDGMDIDPHKLSDETYRSLIFTSLVQEYQDRIYRYCVNRLGEAQGEEIAQDVFLTAWESLAKFRRESTISTWLTGIAKNKCIQAFRNRGRRQIIASTFVEDIRSQSHAEGAVSPEDIVMHEARRQELSQGMSKMREDERLLLNLRYHKGLPVAEVAELLGKSEAAVRKRLLRALERLRKIMTTDGAG